MKCLVCEHEVLTPIYDIPSERGLLKYFRCANCRLIQLGEVVDREDLKQVYNDDEYWDSGEQTHGYFNYVSDAERESFVAEHRNRLGFLAKKGVLSRGLTGMKAIDIGAGAGYSTLALKQAGADAVGVEPSGQMCAFGRETLGVTMENTMFEEYDVAEGSQNLVVTWGTSCHFTDPVATFTKARKVLKPGGMLLFDFFCTESFFMRFQEKNYRTVTNTIYRMNSIAAPILAERAGFSDVRVLPYHPTFGISHYLQLGSARWLSRILPQNMRITYPFPGFYILAAKA